MATFQDRVQDLSGTQADTAALTDWLTAGGRIVSDKFNSDRLDLYATDKSDTGTGVDITGGRALSAHKAGYPALRVLADQKAALTDANSNRYALASDPKWYVEKTKGYVIPSGGTIRFFAYPSVPYNGTSISDFPPQGIDPIIYYAAIQSANRVIVDLLRTSIEGLSFADTADLSAPAAPSFSFTPVSYSNASYSNAAYEVQPYVDALISSITATTISALGTAPVFNMPVFGGDFSTVGTPLDTNSDIELSNAHLNRVEKYLSRFGVDIQNAIQKFNEGNTSYQADVQKKIEQARLDQQRLIQEAVNQVELNKFNAQTEINTLLQNAQKTSDIDAINKAKAMELDITNKSKALEAAIINSSKALEADISEYQASLSRYSNQIQDRSVKINQEVSRMQSNLQKFQIEYTGLFETIKNLKEEYNRLMEMI